MEEFTFLLKQSIDICGNYEGRKYKDGELKKLFMDDLLKMGYLLAALDGIIDKSELKMLCSIYEQPFTESVLYSRYHENKSVNGGFLQRIPDSVLYIIGEERRKNQASFCNFMKDSRVLYKTIKKYGYMVITCNSLKLPYQVSALDKFAQEILRVILNAEDSDIINEESRVQNNSYFAVKKEDEKKKTDKKVKTDKKTLSDPESDKMFEVINESYNRAGKERDQKEEKEWLEAKRKRDEDEAAVSKSVSENGEFDVNNVNRQAEIKKILDEIDGMIGLLGVKKEIHSLVNILMVRKLREERGLKLPVMSNHLVFTGNPGTGKTTVARKMAEIYKCLGILKSGHLVETDRAGMVAGYMGQTAEKVTELADKAMGGILFIDEAYTLSSYKMEGDFGQEAIDTLLKIMEDRRENFVVIVAGYPEPMEDFLNSNPGLRSRFNKHITFEDYTAGQLNEIFHQMCREQDYLISDDAEEELLYNIGKLIADGGENFANARAVRNYFEQIVARQANRIMEIGAGDMDTLITIEKADL